MFKEKIKEVLELVYEIGEKTDSYVFCSYDSRTKMLMIITDEGALTISDGRCLQKQFEKVKSRLKELITEGNIEKKND